MKVTLFVTGSAAVLATWLTMTYIETVPVKGYPQLGRGSVPLSAQANVKPEATVASSHSSPAAAAPVAVKKSGRLLARTSAVEEMEAVSH